MNQVMIITITHQISVIHILKYIGWNSTDAFGVSALNTLLDKDDEVEEEEEEEEVDLED